MKEVVPFLIEGRVKLKEFQFFWLPLIEILLKKYFQTELLSSKFYTLPVFHEKLHNGT